MTGHPRGPRAYLPPLRAFVAALQSDDKNWAFRRCQGSDAFSSGAVSKIGKADPRVMVPGCLRQHLAQKVDMHRAWWFCGG